VVIGGARVVVAALGDPGVLYVFGVIAVGALKLGVGVPGLGVV
jgi:hypothetical protein